MIFCAVTFSVYHCNCVDKIPLLYILKRYSKPDITEGSARRGMIAGPGWRLDMKHQFYKLIFASADNEITRGIVKYGFEKAKAEVVAILGGIDVSDLEGSDVDVIQNPKEKTTKGENFKRKRSIKDVATSRARGKHKADATRARKKATGSRAVDTTLEHTKSMMSLRT